MTTLSHVNDKWRITVHRAGLLMNVEASGHTILDAANTAKFRIEDVRESRYVMLVVRSRSGQGGSQEDERDWPLNIWNTGGPEHAATYAWEWWLDHVRTKEGKDVVHDRSQGAVRLVRTVWKRQVCYETSYQCSYRGGCPVAGIVESRTSF